MECGCPSSEHSSRGAGAGKGGRPWTCESPNEVRTEQPWARPWAAPSASVLSAAVGVVRSWWVPVGWELLACRRADAPVTDETVKVVHWRRPVRARSAASAAAAWTPPSDGSGRKHLTACARLRKRAADPGSVGGWCRPPPGRGVRGSDQVFPSTRRWLGGPRRSRRVSGPGRRRGWRRGRREPRGRCRPPRRPPRGPRPVP